MKKIYIMPAIKAAIKMEESSYICATSEIERDDTPYGDNPGEDEFDTKAEKPSTEDLWDKGWE